LQDGPLLAVGDGAMGFWAALEEVFPATRGQRCWFHYADHPIMPVCSHNAAAQVVNAAYASA
jgi:transposase-like protein